jgi:hypothetical protein
MNSEAPIQDPARKMARKLLPEEDSIVFSGAVLDSFSCMGISSQKFVAKGTFSHDNRFLIEIPIFSQPYGTCTSLRYSSFPQPKPKPKPGRAKGDRT